MLNKLSVCCVQRRRLIFTTPRVYKAHAGVSQQQTASTDEQVVSVAPNVLKSADDNADADDTEWQQVYESPFGGTIKMLKRVSVGSAVMATGAIPYLYLVPPTVSESMAPAMVAGSVILLTGWGSTALLSLALKSYVFKIHAPAHLIRDGQELEQLPMKMERIDMLSRPVVTFVEPNQLQPRSLDTKWPLVTWELPVKGTNKREYFFVHREVFDH